MTYNVNYFADRKIKYEKNHGVFLHEFMFTEHENRILGQANIALNNLQRKLDEEIARAKAEEQRIENSLTLKINNETDRATAKENELQINIDTALNPKYSIITGRDYSVYSQIPDLSEPQDLRDILTYILLAIGTDKNLELTINAEDNLSINSAQNTLQDSLINSYKALMRAYSLVKEPFSGDPDIEQNDKYKNYSLAQFFKEILTEINNIKQQLPTPGPANVSHEKKEDK